MMLKAVGVILLLLFFTLHVHGTRYSAPGKPTLTRCRSPEKETFTCWWEPGSDGGLATSYALYYRKENSDTVFECPDYHTAGKNSCFFNKNNTSIWVNYNITVVASNALGSTFSDPVDIDVVYIVKPNPPEGVKVTVIEDKGWPFLRVSWEPPHKADTRSGWITLIYEIRVKLEEENDWEMHLAGQQKMFNIFSLRSGGTYLVEVRCKPDHGFWSEWTSPLDIKVPDYFHRDKSVWILITIFSAFIFLILTWLLHMNSHSLKHCLLPPVPGPKIKGFDKQLLKNGKSEEIFGELVVADFPPTTSSNYEDLLVEYLEVYIPEEQELMLGEGKDLHDGCLKCESSTSDSDSGHGSCDSHTLLLDKCTEAKEERQRDQERTGGEAQRYQNNHWEKDALTYAQGDMVSPDLSSGRVKTWPSVFSPSPLPQYSSSLPEQQRSLKMAKHQYLSDSLFPPGCESSYHAESSTNTREALGSSHSEFHLNDKQPQSLHSQAQARRHLQAHSDINISSITHKQTPGGLPSPSLCSTEYVEVQRVNEEDMVLLQPVMLGIEGCPQVAQGEDYSKVKGVERNNVLLLQREVTGENSCMNEHQETNGARENCYMPSSVTTQKSMVCGHTAMPAQDEVVPAVNGYIDTATMCTLPSY